MALLCCTSDLNNDTLLGFVDVRLYYLWVAFVDKEADIETQLQQMEALYASIYSESPPADAVTIPELDCLDYDDDGFLDYIDVRFYYVWSAFVDKEQPQNIQLQQMDTLYASIYSESPVSLAVRRPEILNPANCVHGWFVTPWFQLSPVVNTGWLE